MNIREKYKKRRSLLSCSVKLAPNTTQILYNNQTVEGNFDCSYTDITSLKGSPSRVNGEFYCHVTKITSLEGAPSYVGQDFYCSFTDILSLHDVHKHIKYIGGRLVLSSTTAFNILGVMFIKGVKNIGFVQGIQEQRDVATIINKHLRDARDPHACQEELIEAGFAEYAKL